MTLEEALDRRIGEGGRMCAHLCYEPRYAVTLVEDDATGGWLVIWSSNLLSYRDHVVYADLSAFGEDYPVAYHSDGWKPGKAPRVVDA